MSDWPLTIDGDDYESIPQSWIRGGVEAPNNHDGPRLYAVSAALVIGGRCLRVRYGHPQSGEVIVRICDASLNRAEGTYLPAGLTNHIDDWVSSYVPVPEPPEFEPLRAAEYDHLGELWGDKLGRPDGLTDGYDGRPVA